MELIERTPDLAERLAIGVEDQEEKDEMEDIFRDIDDDYNIEIESQLAGICYLLKCDFNDLQTLISTVFNLPKDHYPEGYITQ